MKKHGNIIKINPGPKSQYQILLEEVLVLDDYTFSRIAQDLNVSQTTLIRIYQGKTKNPRVDLASGIYRLHIFARPDLWQIGSGWKIQVTLLDKPSYL